MSYNYLDHLENKVENFRSMAENYFEKEHGKWRVKVTLKDSGYILTAREKVRGTIHMLHYTNLGPSKGSQGVFLSGPCTNEVLQSFTVKNEKKVTI